VRRTLLFATALLVGTVGAGGNAWAATAPSPTAAPTTKATARVIAGHESFSSGTKQVLRLSPESAPPQTQAQVQAQARAAQALVALPATAKINVTYIGFSAPAKAAFQAAVNIWQTQIHSTVPIDVTADWSNLTAQFNDPNILGAAGPTDFVKNFTNAPVQEIYYPVALANAIAGSDQLPANVCSPSDPSNASGAEISASFNSVPGAPWYYGTDGHPLATQVDLESVVLHELGHGLGFVGTFDGLDPSTGIDNGKGYFGLSGDGLNLTVFDTLVSDGSGALLKSYVNGSPELGTVLRDGANGARWNGTNGVAANLGARPLLYSPGPSFAPPHNSWEEGSSFVHLDETTYPKDNANALMTPGLLRGEVTHLPGPIVLGMFQDMGWPQTGTPTPTTIGDYNVAAPLRLASSHTVTTASPLTVQVTGVDNVPANATAVAVTVTVQSPNKAGVWSTLPGCSGSGALPDSQNFQAGQTRTSQSVLPLDSLGRIRISLTGATSGVVSVDLVGWYAASGVSYHPLTQKQAFSASLTATPVDLKILGVAGVPASGVTAVAVSAGVGFETTPGFVLVGPGGVNTIAPTVGYQVGEFTQNLAVVPVGTGTAAGKIRVRLNVGRASVVLYVVGWYGPSTAGGLNFHSAGPARLSAAPHGQDVTISGLPGSTPVLLNIHLGSTTAAGSLSVAPGGSLALALVQEMKAKQNTSGRTIVTTNATGQVHLHLSVGTATFYTDFEGWFSN
jgi:hypothetical protein